MPDLQALTTHLQAREDIRMAILFGSRVQGQPRPSSDVDLGILLAPNSAPDFLRLRGELSRIAGGEVDLVDLDSAPPLLRFKIAKHGRALVAKDEADWARFRVRAMVDWYDWQPTARAMWARYRARLKEDVADGRP